MIHIHTPVLNAEMLKNLNLNISYHSWFTLVMNTLIASIGIGFQVTISKSEVQMTSKLVFPGPK